MKTNTIQGRLQLYILKISRMSISIGSSLQGILPFCYQIIFNQNQLLCIYT